jgi:hypothetical protein
MSNLASVDSHLASARIKTRIKAARFYLSSLSDELAIPGIFFKHVSLPSNSLLRIFLTNNKTVITIFLLH